ncbi:hypothetical protein M885DRAFT_406008, partial [Pelagophyceae sp. CCMP2097]
CTKCKSRHYCGKACQLVDWYDRGHKAQCKQLAAEFQDRLLDATTLNDAAPDWLGTCAICLDGLPVEANLRRFYVCCCKMMCMACSVKCQQHDDRCPLCRTPASKSDAELLRRLQKHVDKGNALAQMQLGNAYSSGARGLKQSFKRAFQLYELAAAQGCAVAQHNLGFCYACGHGVKIDYKVATRWWRLAAAQGHAHSLSNLGAYHANGQGSFKRAFQLYGRSAAQGYAIAQHNLGGCYNEGHGVKIDYKVATRWFQRAAEQ